MVYIKIFQRFEGELTCETNLHRSDFVNWWMIFAFRFPEGSISPIMIGYAWNRVDYKHNENRLLELDLNAPMDSWFTAWPSLQYDYSSL